jgi:hypothetical protein
MVEDGTTAAVGTIAAVAAGALARRSVLVLALAF